jgi:hypothetical protein
MTTERTPMTAPLTAFAASILRLRATLAEAADAQWQPSHTPQAREDTTERASGVRSDPTLAIVVDDRRLALRDDVRRAEEVLASAAAYADRVEARLARTLDAWAGEKAV